MNHTLKRWMTIVAAVVTPVLAAPFAAAQERTAYVLHSGVNVALLHTIDTARPGNAIATVSITGWRAGEMLVGIDIRPSERTSVCARRRRRSEHDDVVSRVAPRWRRHGDRRRQLH
jgi:hypothetical protein